MSSFQLQLGRGEHERGAGDHNRELGAAAATTPLPCHCSACGTWSASSCASYGASGGSQGGLVGTLAPLVGDARGGGVPVGDGPVSGGPAGGGLAGGVPAGGVPVGGVPAGGVPAGGGQVVGGHRGRQLVVLADRPRGRWGALLGSQDRAQMNCRTLGMGMSEGQTGRSAPAEVALLGGRGGL